MKLELKWIAAAALLMAATIGGVSSTRAEAPEVSLPPFYKSSTTFSPKGKLGEVLAKESVATAIPGARAWRVAYVSSDALDRKTVVTALVVAPKGIVPKGGRLIVSWAHGTTGTARNCGPSQVMNPAQPLNQYHLIGGNSWTDYGIPAVETFRRKATPWSPQTIRAWAAALTSTALLRRRPATPSMRSGRPGPWGSRRQQESRDLRLVTGRRGDGRSGGDVGLSVADWNCL